MKAHAGEMGAARFPESLRFEERQGQMVCGYCGSMTVARATELLKTAGTRYSGSDWKYGFPHKFYLGDGKFYLEHLTDSPAEEVEAFGALSQALLGIAVEVDAKGVKYRAVYRGFQTWGVVGGAPSDGAPVVPHEWWKP